MMPNTNRPALDPFGILSRVLRFVIGLAVLVTAFGGGAIAAPQTDELTQAQLEERLQKKDGTLSVFIDKLERSIHSGDISVAENLIDRNAILNRATRQITFEKDETVRDLFTDSTKRSWDERG